MTALCPDFETPWEHAPARAARPSLRDMSPGDGAGSCLGGRTCVGLTTLGGSPSRWDSWAEKEDQAGHGRGVPRVDLLVQASGEEQ